MASKLRVGVGYDTHPLVKGRKLVIGGVEIPFGKGLDGWSDADVLTHAVMDALLGAAAMGDIGQHFPPGEPEYRDISSLSLLEEVRDKLAAQDWSIVNIDSTVITEEPRLASFIDQIRLKLSETLGMEIVQVSIKASTSNGLGFVGRVEGIAAMAVVLIEERSSGESN